jgi:hypothetical protein
MEEKCARYLKNNTFPGSVLLQRVRRVMGTIFN